MAKAKNKTFLGKLIKLTDSFPSVEEKQEIIQRVDALIDYLNQVKNHIRQLPSEEDVAPTRASLLELESRLKEHRANVMLDNIASAGALHPKQLNSDFLGKQDLDKLSKLELSEMKNAINNENVYPVKRLRSILQALGVRTSTRMVRQELEKLVATKISNNKGYEMLRKSEE